MPLKQNILKSKISVTSEDYRNHSKMESILPNALGVHGITISVWRNKQYSLGKLSIFGTPVPKILQATGFWASKARIITFPTTGLYCRLKTLTLQRACFITDKSMQQPHAPNPTLPPPNNAILPQQVVSCFSSWNHRGFFFSPSKALLNSTQKEFQLPSLKKKFPHTMAAISPSSRFWKLWRTYNWGFLSDTT